MKIPGMTNKWSWYMNAASVQGFESPHMADLALTLGAAKKVVVSMGGAFRCLPFFIEENVIRRQCLRRTYNYLLNNLKDSALFFLSECHLMRSPAFMPILSRVALGRIIPTEEPIFTTFRIMI